MKKWSSDRWISIVAIVASLGTLFTIIYQTNIFRTQQYASVLPYLELWNSRNNDSYRLILINNGIGPAFIEEVNIIYKDSIYKMDPAVFVQRVIDPIDTITRMGHSNIGKGRLVPAGTRIDLVQVENDSINSLKLWSWFSGGDPNRIDLPEIEITYKSVYGEKWMIQKYGTDQPVQLE